MQNSPDLQPQPEEIIPFELGFNPDDSAEVERRSEMLKNIDQHIAEIKSKLSGVLVDKLNIRLEDKNSIRFIRNNIEKLAALKDNVELTLGDIKKIEDSLGNFVMSLGYLDRESQPNIFFEKLKETKDILDEQLKIGIKSDKGRIIQ